MRAEPGGVAAAGGETPAPGDADAAFDGDAAPGAGQFRPPGEDAARRPENLARHGRVEIGGGHRAARILPQGPGGARLGLGDLFEHLNIGQRVKLGSAHRARQQQPEKAALDQCLDHLFGQLALRLDLVGGICEHRRQICGRVRYNRRRGSRWGPNQARSTPSVSPLTGGGWVMPPLPRGEDTSPGALPRRFRRIPASPPARAAGAIDWIRSRGQRRGARSAGATSAGSTACGEMPSPPVAAVAQAPPIRPASSPIWIKPSIADADAHRQHAIDAAAHLAAVPPDKPASPA